MAIGRGTESWDICQGQKWGTREFGDMLPKVAVEREEMTVRATRARKINSTKKDLSSEQRDELLTALKARFEKNMSRHQGLAWANVKAKLEGNNQKLWSVSEMERTGGEPDVVGHDKKTGEYIFYDCSAESFNRARYFAGTVASR